MPREGFCESLACGPVVIAGPVGPQTVPGPAVGTAAFGAQPFVGGFWPFWDKSTRKIVKRIEEKFDVFGFFQGFSGRVVWKTIRAGLPHRFAPIQSSRNQHLSNFLLIFIFFNRLTYLQQKYRRVEWYVLVFTASVGQF